MNFGSVCSGIEAASAAWEPLGWKAQFLSEIEPFPAAVLAHHYPTVPNLGDMTKFKEWKNHDIDVLVGGTPCQSFSVAGLRKGLADPRGNLMLTYLAIADKYRPEWLVWENVPGVLSSNGGKDFGTFLGGLGELGYGFAYRVLDAQHFGVPQRRRRVFVVGCLGDWRAAAAVLFERHSLQGNPAPSRGKGKDAAFGLVGGIDYENNGHGVDQPTGPLLKGSPTGGGRPLPAVVTGTMCMATGQAGAEISPTLNCNHEAPIVFDTTQITSRANGCNPQRGDPCHPLAAGAHAPAIALSALQVRRLTPRECERLQGFPDDYTQVPYRGRHAADGPRYKALGNSMAVPVMAWIGSRIDAADSVRTARVAA